MIVVKTPKEIALMKEAGRVAARVLEALQQEIKPGITTADLDKLAETLIRKAGGEPVFKLSLIHI